MQASPIGADSVWQLVVIVIADEPSFESMITIHHALADSLPRSARNAYVEVREIGSKDHLSSYRLFIHGMSTPVMMDVSRGTAAPTVTWKVVPDGTICGTLVHFESGAYLQTLSIAFVAHQKWFWNKDQARVAGSRGNTVLIVPVQRGPWADPANAILVNHETTTDLGWATEAFLKASDTVEGWYYSNSDSQPTRGLVNEASPTFKQYFVWRHGQRSLKGKKPTE